MSYIITSEAAHEGLPYLGRPVGYITCALTGATVATFRDTLGGIVKIHLDTPLCDQCDQPVSDDECACLAPVVRVSDTRIAA